MLNKLRSSLLVYGYSNFKLGNINLGNFKMSYENFFPEYKKLWVYLCSVKYAENTFKQKLLDELISECDLKDLNFFAQTSGKPLLIQLNFKILKDHGLDLNHASISNKLLNHLEPFPFDSKDLEKQEPNNLSIAKIRNIIERQYLAWKFKVDEEVIISLSYRFRYCFYPFRSFTNLKSIIEQLETVPEIQSRNVSEKIYLVNQKPFDINTAIDFKKNVAGVVWYMLPGYCNKMLLHSHQYILSVVSVLQSLNFTEIQIQEGLPFLHIPFRRLVSKLNNLLNYPEISIYRNENLFLKLLFFPSALLKPPNMSFTELIEIVKNSKKHKLHTTRKDIFCIISQFYEISPKQMNKISSYSGLRKTSEKQIYDTLCFLKENKFTSEEVAESLEIIFQPRELIARKLAEIKGDESMLKEIGFVDGCVPEETCVFSKGTRQRRKTLQLCLYYIEKEIYF